MRFLPDCKQARLAITVAIRSGDGCLDVQTFKELRLPWHMDVFAFFEEQLGVLIVLSWKPCS